MPARLVESDLLKVAGEFGVSKDVLLAALLSEYCLLPRGKQLEILGDHFLRSADNCKPEGEKCSDE